MLMAALGSVHGDLPALEAVLRVIDDAGIQTIVNTGDCVVGHPWPNEVIDLLRARSIPCVQGEWDRSVARFLRKGKTLQATYSPQEFEALRDTYECLRSDNVEFLAGLPRQRIIVVDGLPVCVCYGSPYSQMDALRPDDDVARFQRIRESVQADLFVCGRVTEPFSREVSGALFVNPGALHRESDAGPRAWHAVIDTESEPWQVRFNGVPYVTP